ncbi:unnamed protein product [Diabrotica balteata]|uniref:C2H2-type domain-containing protein n=1 Tax=Diabrotica balteata TaxID=107213 RepID=A0A9N9X7G7_DIABA|nr:unnamed protein product [Diabrotica balteata]
MAFRQELGEFVNFSKEQFKSKNESDKLSFFYPGKNVKIKIEEDVEISYHHLTQSNTPVKVEDFKIGLSLTENIKQEYEECDPVSDNIGAIDLINSYSTNISRESIYKAKSDASRILPQDIKVEIKQEHEQCDYFVDKLELIHPSDNYSRENIGIPKSDASQISLQGIKVEIKEEYEHSDFVLDTASNIHTTHLNTEVKLEDFVELESNKSRKIKIKTVNRRKKLQDYSHFTKKWLSRLKLTRNKNEIHSCSFCGKTCMKSSILMSHYKVSHFTKKVMQKKQTAIKPSILYDLLKKENDQILIKESSYADHYTFDESEKSYSCTLCPQKFVDTSELKSHFGLHTEQKLFDCTVCYNKFNSSKNLATHLFVNSREKPYTCEICLSQFSTNCYLLVHTRLHAMQKPHKCQVCLKQFTQIDQLLYHQIEHTVDKPLNVNFVEKGLKKKIKWNNTKELSTLVSDLISVTCVLRHLLGLTT